MRIMSLLHGPRTKPSITRTLPPSRKVCIRLQVHCMNLVSISLRHMLLKFTQLHQVIVILFSCLYGHAHLHALDNIIPPASNFDCPLWDRDQVVYDSLNSTDPASGLTIPRSIGLVSHYQSHYQESPTSRFFTTLPMPISDRDGQSRYQSSNDYLYHITENIDISIPSEQGYAMSHIDPNKESENGYQPEVMNQSQSQPARHEIRLQLKILQLSA